MQVRWALIIGLVQGLTEFIPVSSSGHLVFMQEFFLPGNAGLFFDVILHMGSLCALLIFFRKMIIGLAAQTFKAVKNGQFGQVPRVVWLVAVASFPAFVIGFIGHDLIGQIFTSPRLLPFSFGLTGCLLLSVKKEKKHHTLKGFKEMTIKDALTIGLWQALAILPGVSRSGSTYAGGIARRLNRQDAFYFTFLIAIPAIAGAFLLELITGARPAFSTELWIGFLAAFGTGLAGLAGFKKLIEWKKIYLFGYYCFALSLLSWIVFW